MSIKFAGWLAIAVYVLIMGAILMLVSKVFGIWWELGLIPIEVVGGIALGTFVGTARARWDEPPPYALQAAKNLYRDRP